MNHPTSRRSFIKYSTLGLLTLPALQFLQGCFDNKSGGELPAGQNAVPATDPTATALGYSEDASKTDTAKFPKRAGAEGAKQFCKGCNFYTSSNENWGKCQLLTTGLVNAHGWCNSWIQKPGT